MSKSELLQSYETFVDDSLERLSNRLISRLDTLNYIDFRDAAIGIVDTFFNSDEVKQFKADAEELEKKLEDDEKAIAVEYNKTQVIKKMNTDINIYGKLKMFDYTIKELKQNPPRPSSQDRSYDQVVKGNVKISKVKNNSEYSHKIKFNKIGKFLQYQVWDPTGIAEQTHLPRYPFNEKHPNKLKDAIKYIQENPDKVVVTTYPINDDRDVKLITGKEWVLFFNSVINFSPTTVMQIGYKKHVFVLKKAEINKNNKVVFYISTKEIQVNNNNNNNKSEQMKNLKKIPLGKHKNVRFDIDYGNSGRCVSDTGIGICSCPPGSDIVSMGSGMAGTVVAFCRKQCDPGYSIFGDFCVGGQSGCHPVFMYYYNGFNRCPSAKIYPVILYACPSSWIGCVGGY
jgi:hypothetical protein